MEFFENCRRLRLDYFSYSVTSSVFHTHSSTGWDIEEQADYRAPMARRPRCNFLFSQQEVYGNIHDVELACYYEVESFIPSLSAYFKSKVNDLWKTLVQSIQPSKIKHDILTWKKCLAIWFSLVVSPAVAFKDTHREKAPPNKIPELTKYEYRHLGRWYFKPALYKRFLNRNKIFKK